MHRRKHHSQSGEDGALEFLLARIATVAPLKRYFIEFGAWDGMHLSNTFVLAERHGFAGLLVEGDAQKYLDLQKTLLKVPSVVGVQEYVRPSGEHSLDNIVTRVKGPSDIDVLSIDVDGDDYHIWKGIQTCHPKVVIIEINLLLKPGVVRVAPLSEPFVWGVSGSSITSLCDLAREKGYGLVANVGCNAIFVRGDILLALDELPVTEATAFTYEGFSLKQLAVREMFQKAAYRVLAQLPRVNASRVSL